MTNKMNDDFGTMLGATMAGLGETQVQTDERRVAEATVEEFWVSTVRLTIDHGFDGTPKWYETMVFDHRTDSDNLGDLYCDRYETREQALAGHEKAVAWVRAGRPEQDA